MALQVHLHQFPQVTRAQIEQSFADIERRFERGGYSLRPVHKLRCITALEMGDLTAAASFERLWQEGQKDAMGDCEACDVNSHVGYFIDLGKDDEAIKEAAPVMKGRMKCGEVPGLTFSRLLLPLLRAGRAKDAASCHKKSIAQMRESRKFISNVAEHVVYLALAGDDAKALKLFELRLPWAAETRKLHDRFNYYLAGELLMRRLHAAGRTSIRIRLPQVLDAYRRDETYAIASLAAWFKNAAAEIAKQFDQRNGNDHYTRRLAHNEQLARLPVKAA